jgi:outer membrane protein TolC
MKLRHVIIITAFIFLSAIQIVAVEIPLNIETAVSLALRNNLGLKADRIDLETRKRAKQNSWNEFLPSVNLGVGLTHSGGASTTTAATSGSSPLDMSASITASLPLSSANVHSLQNTKLTYEAEEISLEEAEKQLKRDVKKTFYNLILLGEKIRLIDQNIETAEKRYEQAKANYENGIVSELTVLSAQVTLENLKPDLEEAEVTYTIAELQFKQVLGLGRDSSLSLEGSIEPEALSLESEILSQEYVSNRLDVQGILKAIEILETKRKLTSAEEYTPTLSLSYSFRAGVNDPFRADWGSAGSWSDSSTFGISLSFPLDGFIPGSSSNLKIKEMDDSIAKARLNLTQSMQLAEVEIESIVLRLDKSLRTLKALEQNVLLAQKTYDLTEKQYNAGAVDLLDVEEAYDALQEAKLGVLEERYNYLSGLLDLEYALNYRLDI